MGISQLRDIQAGDERSAQFLNVPKEAKCDLIMKGGIASGVLYPPAIIQLATSYRFHEIGGTSAGAIAAAAAAAAEYGRATHDESSSSANTSGFVRLEELAQQLANEHFVFDLFQPSNGTTPLFHTLLDIRDWFPKLKKDNQHPATLTRVDNQPTKRGSWLTLTLAYLGRITSISRKNTPIAFRSGQLRGMRWGIVLALSATLLMLLIAAVYLVTALLLGDTTSWNSLLVTVLLFGLVLGMITGYIGWYVGGIVSSVSELVRLGKLLTDPNKSLYGICSGIKSSDEHEQIPKSTDTIALTEWLTISLNELAGLDTDWLTASRNQLKHMGGLGPILTFEHLISKEIDFRLVTTNLSEGQPYVLPLQKATRFDPIFSELDMLKLFPVSVVEYLKQNGREHQSSNVQLPKGYYFLPERDKLPVVVATRMSLSFPVLLSAVRLYTLKGSAYQNSVASEEDLHEHWFSDGGITSNFPIHMFDTWRPTHPTFGIKLYGWLSPTPDDAAESKREDSVQPQNRVADMIARDGVYLPQPSDTQYGGSPIWKPIESLQNFLGQILDTMQNYHDNTQSMLPGYRERIVQVYLRDNEGGMNLNMPPDIVEKVINKGHIAGMMFTNKPDDSDPDQVHFDFEQHQWVRFRVLMAQLEQEVDTLKHNSLDMPNNTTYDRLVEAYCQLIDKQLEQPTGRKWYRSMGKDECEQAKKRVRALWGFIKEWDEATEELRVAYEAQPADSRPRSPFSEEFFRHNAPIPPAVLRVTPEL